MPHRPVDCADQPGAAMAAPVIVFRGTVEPARRR